MTKYLTAAETAKIVRQALKAQFGKELKFWVRSSTYAGGASIRVEWIDGPDIESVRTLVNQLEGGYFDGMTDYKGGHIHRDKETGEEINFGADFIFTERRHSPEAVKIAMKRAVKEYGVDPGEFAYQTSENDPGKGYTSASYWHEYDHEKSRQFRQILREMGEEFAAGLSVPASNNITNRFEHVRSY